MLKAIIAVGLGSCTGGILRYLVSKLSDSVTDGRFPLGTLAVNLAGCLIIGILSALAEKGGIANANVRLFLTVGICGGFTTFSTFHEREFPNGTRRTLCHTACIHGSKHIRRIPFCIRRLRLGKELVRLKVREKGKILTGNTKPAESCLNIPAAYAPNGRVHF